MLHKQLSRESLFVQFLRQGEFQSEPENMLTKYLNVSLINVLPPSPLLVCPSLLFSHPGLFCIPIIIIPVYSGDKCARNDPHNLVASLGCTQMALLASGHQ